MIGNHFSPVAKNSGSQQNDKKTAICRQLDEQDRPVKTLEISATFYVRNLEKNKRLF